MQLNGKTIASVCLLASAVVTVAAFTAYVLESRPAVFGREEPEQPSTAAVVTAPAEAVTAPPATFDEPAVTEPPEDGTFVKEGGETYYYIDGERIVNGIVGNDEEGYFYVNRTGAVDKTFCGSVQVYDTTWNVILGKAEIVEDDWDRTLNRALLALSECTSSRMSKDEKLKRAFRYLQETYLEGSRRDTYLGMDWPVVYADDLFVGGKGDCFSYAAAFAFMAKAIGFEEVYACNSGGHGWAEVAGRIYDPEWSMHSKKYSYFGMRYSDKCDLEYGNCINEDDYSHIKL